MNTPADNSLPVIALPKEILERPDHDGPVIEPTDLFDIHGRHIVVNQVVEGGKLSGLLRYTILSKFEVTFPDGRKQEYDITCPMNGFKGGRKQAFEMHDQFLSAYRETFEKNFQAQYAAAMAKKVEMEKLRAAESTQEETKQKAPSAILGADGQAAAGSKSIEIPSHDPTLAERHVPKDGQAKVQIHKP